MAEIQNDKPAKVVSKPFLTAGPTLHYSHDNVQGCWFLALVSYGVTCLFWLKILTGSFGGVVAGEITLPVFSRLGQAITTGISIFEYPWQILILGSLMAILSITPILISQLMSFVYSIPFILASFFIARLPGLSMFLFVCCFAVACRPLRFRSRFVSITLATAPLLVYWVYFGAARGTEPLKWGFAYLPWFGAWIIGLGIAGIILGIGHYTRYRPGLVWVVSSLFLLSAIFIFEITIGFDELDYQLYIVRNNPEESQQFRDHSITEALDQSVKSKNVKTFLTGFFYPDDPIMLRKELKREIQEELFYYDTWPGWFIVPEELDYQSKRQKLLGLYNDFIAKRSNSKRMVQALYFKAILTEYNPDIRMLGDKEVLHFYSDYSDERARNTWYTLYSQFSDSPESIESRWRIASGYAQQGRFPQAQDLLDEALKMIQSQTAERSDTGAIEQSIFDIFEEPSVTVMTQTKLNELGCRIKELRELISEQNQGQTVDSQRRLAEFLRLNPYGLHYERNLDSLISRVNQDDPLYDNLQLAKAMLIIDEERQAEEIQKLYEQYKGRDGGVKALYRLAHLKMNLWRRDEDIDAEYRKKCLTEAREALTEFLKLYPDSIYIDRVRTNLESLPESD